MHYDEKLAIYIHIPFCRKRCNYCDFCSRVGTRREQTHYLEALRAEILSSPWRGAKAETLFLGGGTPSEIGTDALQKLVETVSACFEFGPDAEWSIECNPGTLDPFFSERLLKLGFNRVSLGVQSFHDHFLNRLGRIHSAQEALSAFSSFRAAGFENINLDLIFALPGQCLGEFEADLETALRLAPEHLSLYNLTIEKGTPFGDDDEAGRLNVPSEDVQAAMYERSMDLSEWAGYQQYEISNYCRPGFECRHNMAYWTNSPYLGFGLSAASYIEGRRWTNTQDWDEYLRLAPQNALVPQNVEELTGIHALSEEIMLRLRTRQGLPLGKLSQKYGYSIEDLYADSIRFLVEQGLLLREGDTLQLTRKGRLLSNEVSGEFLGRSADPEPLGHSEG